MRDAKPSRFLNCREWRTFLAAAQCAAAAAASPSVLAAVLATQAWVSGNTSRTMNRPSADDTLPVASGEPLGT